MLRIIACCFFVAALCGCGKPLMKGAVLGENDAYYVFGLKPSNVKVQVYPGSIQGDGRFKLSAQNAVFNAVANQGYAVGAAKAGSTLAVTRLILVGTGSLIPPIFLPCNNTETMVFTAAKGKIIYLADLGFSLESDNTLTVTYEDNIEAARSFLEIDYPQLAPYLERGEFRRSKTSMPCVMYF